MFVYANLIGNWTELTDDDLINDLNPQIFVEKALCTSDNLNYFVKVQTDNNKIYHIHVSCIQYTYKKINNFSD